MSVCLSGGVSGCPWLSVAPQTHLRHKSNAIQTHLKRNSNARRTQLECSSNAPQKHRKRIPNAPQTHRKPSKSLTKTMSKKWVYICLYTFIYLHIPLNSFIYLHIYTPIYMKILNIRKMRSDIRPKNSHKWGPRGSPWVRIWHVP